MFVLLHGAIKNVGDFLIFERAKALLREYASADEFLEIPRWEPLEPYLDRINKADAIVLCGGPAYASDFYPGIYPLVEDLSRIKPPIFPLGLGWSGKSGDSFTFTDTSLEAIKLIHSQIEKSSVRDNLTQKMLQERGISNVEMTGCPAWYHLPSIEAPFDPPSQIREIALSTPARPINFLYARRLIDWVKHRYPRAKCHIVFHRGIWYDRNTPKKDALLNPPLAAYGALRGMNIVNASYSTRHIEFYKDIDLHIGFRVHGHINALSYRRPSILIHEDGRGQGQTVTLGTRDVEAHPDDLAGRLNTICNEYERSNFVELSGVFDVMRHQHEVMKSYIESIGYQ